MNIKKKALESYDAFKYISLFWWIKAVMMDVVVLIGGSSSHSFEVFF